jgi:predicted negative regulator of RcsB-dependent stress response
MAYDLEEQEQLDQLKAWWNKFGGITLTLLSVALVAVLGWQGFNWYQNHQATQARGYFEALERASLEPGPDAVPRITAAMNTLQIDFPKTDYAARAALVASAALLNNQDVESAQRVLTWLAQSEHVALVPIARFRMAGILLDLKQHEPALAQLQAPPPAFEALFADRRGDVLAAQGKPQEAVAQWRRAIELLGAGDPLSGVVQLKIDTTGV